MKIFKLTFITLIAFIAVFVWTKPAHAGSVALSLTPATVSVTNGNTFDLNAAIAAPSDQINMVDLRLNYNASQLEITSGPTWADICSGADAPVQWGAASNTNGVYSILMGYPTTCFANRTATIFSVTFRAKTAGSSQITLTNTDVVSGLGAITESYTGANVTITSTGGTTTPPPATGGTTTPPASSGTSTTPKSTSSSSNQYKSTGTVAKPVTVPTNENPIVVVPTQTNEPVAQAEERSTEAQSSDGVFGNLLKGLEVDSQVLVEGVIIRLVYISSAIIIGIVVMAFSVYFIWGRKV